MGRPKLKNPRGEAHISIPVTHPEKARAKERAKKAKLSLSEFGRRAVLGEAGK